MEFNIQCIKKDLLPELNHKIDTKTKPIGALGRLEDLARQIALIQNTLTPELKNPAIVVFAGDHGIAEEGVSLFPQEVSYQMVLNFLNSGAAINVFCKQNAIDIKVVDAGVKFDFEDHPGLIKAKISNGTKNFLHEPAMTIEQCNEAISKGAAIVRELHQNDCNIIGFGEMGIANTSSASVLFSLISNTPIENCVGRGTGLADDSLKKKKEILKRAIDNYKGDHSPISILSHFGGFEIAMLSGAMMQAAELGMVLMIDGFIVTSALIVAAKLYPNIMDYCIFCHKSNELGHLLMLNYFQAEPLLNLELRLGEGTGAAVAYPVIKAAITFLNDMASFESANVSDKMD